MSVRIIGALRRIRRCESEVAAQVVLEGLIAEVSDELWERIHAMGKVLAYVGECAGVEPGDVNGLIGWADSKRAHPSSDGG